LTQSRREKIKTKKVKVVKRLTRRSCEGRSPVTLR